jgi:uncharacterized damage-inducible protein DinB
MRAEVRRLEEQLRLSFEGPAWHGPSVLEALDGVTAAGAHRRPIEGVHSIWELVLHIAGGYRLVLRRLEGDGRPQTGDEDWPAVPAATDANWAADVRMLRDLNAQLRGAIRAFDPDRLDDPLVEHPPYSAYTQFIGMTQHDLYHAGQIVLLKRAGPS